MTDISKATYQGIDTDSAMRAVNLGGLGLEAGEAIAAWDACYIKASDGKVYKAVSTEVNGANVSLFHGFAPQAYAAGDKVTLYGDGALIEYASGMTPAAYLYISDTAGRLADADTTSGFVDKPVATVITATHILVESGSRFEPLAYS